MEVNYTNYIELHYFSSNKLIVITPNKVASRYVSKFFTNFTEGNIRVNLNFEIFEGNIESNNSKESMSFLQIKEEWNSILNDNSKKEILFLYRNPVNRILSGITQDFITSICQGIHVNYPFSFLLKNTLKDKPSGILTYKYILKNREGSFSEGYDEEVISDIHNNIIELFQDYFNEISITPITFTDHTNLYLIYLYMLITSNNIDNNKFYLFDIDNKKYSLRDIFKKYELTINENEEDIISSNKSFIDVYEKLLSDEIESKYDIKEIHKLIIDSIRPDIISYEKLKQHPNNIKSEIRN